ncbi:hypothetical protein R3P38DRAFT_3303123 [Favolaschia claudopus]|uniref:Uncharacterized protein n=1 Tax=Favolaschia claudopus TaxID=2862362 RepID=A0AAW0ED69_9AGAR
MDEFEDPPGASAGGKFDGSDDVDIHSCRLLGPIALTVQGLMGVLVILSLVYKRHREKPMRPWRIWCGLCSFHAFNVLVSDLVSHHSSNNACTSYFLNILIDTTLGFESGVYGTPPSFKYWLRQAAIYIMALTAMKLIGDNLEVIFVMGIFPIIMNMLQFWLIDSIVKASGIVNHCFIDPDDDDDEDAANPYHTQTDVERHPRPHLRSLSPPSDSRSRSADKLVTPSEIKTSGSSTPGHIVEMHAYPPGSASPSSSVSSSPPQPQAPVLREATKLKPKRRNPPSPITIRNNNRPAVNSPRPGPTPKSAPAPAPAPAPVPPPAPKDEADGWGESWEEADDWADKVGEEDWTGRRLEEKKSVLSGWDSGSPMVNAVHAIET